MSARRPAGAVLVRALDRIGGAGTINRAGRLPRPVVQQLEAIEMQGLTTAAEVHSAAFVTKTAVQLTAVLSIQEAQLITAVPLGEARYRMLVDTFAGVSAAIVARYGL